ncbi:MULTISPECIES: hypothetical protein [Protofrankia]|uniref:Uncharacterized protein n=1 Tax=Candidatus Protofrankia datiscae TaxID=2716812 RepID=F8B067_9ACTN|nr:MULTISPECIES: hypothetical protein [Protofrankia]AEH11771.1 hypothetical protein FsymDg_4523 [Candidatus Protofrankia datiscae]
MRGVGVTGRGFAPFVASVGLAAAVAVVAAIWPSPGRHVHGLLVVISLTLVVGVASAGLRVVAAARGRGTREVTLPEPAPGTESTGVTRETREVTDDGGG